MPKVGKKEFPYTKMGMAEAYKAASSKTPKVKSPKAKQKSKAPSIKAMLKNEAMEQRGYKGDGGD